MANILFASNNTAHFIGTEAGSIAGTYDEDRVPYAIRIALEGIHGSPVFNPSTNGVTWFHFLSYSQEASTGFDDRFLLSAVDADDNLLFHIDRDGSNVGYRFLNVKLYDGTTVKNTKTSLMVPNGSLVSFDIRYEATALKISLELFVNGSRLIEHVFAANPDNYADPIQFTLGGGLADDGNYQYFSEIIIADESTLNARLDLLRPSAAGAYEEWAGSLATLADNDRTSGMTTVAADQRQSLVMSAYGGAPNVSNLVSVSTTTRGQNSPTKLTHSVRLSGVDYDSAEYDVPFAAKYLLTDFQINPATSLAWTAADLAAVEMGFKSIA